MFSLTQKSIGRLTLIVVSIVFVWLYNIILLESRIKQAEENQDYVNNDSNLENQINTVNDEWLTKSVRLHSLYKKYLKHEPIGIVQMKWIWLNLFKTSIEFNPYSERDWRILENRVDVVPVKLLIEQAEIDSHDGTSPLAQQAKNLFNIVISKPEFGVSTIPVSAWQRQLNWLEPYDIQYANYYTTQASIIDYVWMLNTADQFEGFRRYRANLRKQHKPVLTSDSKAFLTLMHAKLSAQDSFYGRNIIPAFWPVG